VHLGVKIGPDNWQDKLDSDLAIECAEIYLDLERGDAYASLFEGLRQRAVEAGMHLSTELPGGFMLNLATEDSQVRAASAALVRRALDLAGEHGMRYLIVHPGSYTLWGIREGVTFVGTRQTLPAKGNWLVLEELLSLAEYARAHGVTLLAENMPGREYASYDPLDRVHTVDVGFPTHADLCQIGRAGVGLCVDIGHLYAEAMLGTGGPDCFSQVTSAARSLAPYAKCIHLSTVVPPWNGTDSHNGFLPKDYARGAVPSRQDLLAWLAPFDPEVWAIPEPWGGADVHLANFRVLKSWLEQDA
jgi:sugar phosphate isomerase/epimerase